MKRIFTVVFLALLCAANAKALMVVELGALTQAVMYGTRVEQAINMGLQLQQQIQAVHNTYRQLQHAIAAEQRALEHMRNITSVNSFGEFMAWYDRQLTNERHRIDRFNNMYIQVGTGPNSRVPLRHLFTYTTVNQLSATYGYDYWNTPFTERQREQMWVNLGLSPRNYVFQRTWMERERSLGARVLTHRENLAEERAIARYNRGLILDEATQEGASQRKVDVAGLFIGSSLVGLVEDIQYDMAVDRELRLAQHQLLNARPEPLYLSTMWGRELFPEPIVEGRFVPFDRFQ